MKVINLLLLLICSYSMADSLRIEVATGTAVQIATPLTIQQAGQPTINEAAAGYSTNPFAPGAAPYYDVRIGLWNHWQTAGWELELLHDKLYLDTLPPGVTQFQITFGYNMLFLNRAWSLNPWFPGFIFRIGVGPVIAHAISTVNGQSYSGPTYSLAGIAYQLGLQYRLKLGGPVSLSAETKWTGASAEVPIANGTAVVPNNGVHFLLGIGVDF